MAAGREAALTLSDVFCVDRHQQEFLGLMRDGFVDILFANESELHALYQTSDFATAVAALRQEKVIAAVTRSEKGAIVVKAKRPLKFPPRRSTNLVDTTGAGDLFAAGFLAAYTRASPLDHCARLGALAASEIIQHFGARPEVELARLAEQSLYLREYREAAPARLITKVAISEFRFSMAEVPMAGHHHRQAGLVGGLDHLVVAH